MKKFQHILVAATTSIFVLGGCTTLVGGEPQVVSVITVDKAGTEIQGASCKVFNNHGIWYMTTPDSGTIKNSKKPLNIICTKDGHKAGSLRLHSGQNFTLENYIGGHAWDYPKSIEVIMGKAVIIGRYTTVRDL